MRGQNDKLVEAVKSQRKLKNTLEKRFRILFDPPAPIDESKPPDGRDAEASK
jgi:hypothetical protein